MEPIISFLNHDLDIVMQKSLLALIKSELVMVPELLLEFRVYTNKDTLVKMGLQPYRYPLEAKAKAPKEAAKIIWLSFWLSFGLLLFPTIYLAQLNVGLLSLSFQQIIVGFLIETNVYLIFYFLTINLIYIILFIIALIGSKRQVNLAKTRKSSLLFTDRLLPGISIIAPAYNEEVSVVDSVHSLLNLKYPNYEVVVVNDGSKDQTLEKLIAAFNLERKHLSYKQKIGTKKFVHSMQLKTSLICSLSINKMVARLMPLTSELMSVVRSMSVGLTLIVSLKVMRF